MIIHSIIFLQSLPDVDFKIFGAFGVCLTLLLIACEYLRRQVNYYRDRVEEVRKEKNDQIDEIRQDKEDLQKERRAETQATIQALKETKEILKAQLDSAK